MAEYRHHTNYQRLEVRFREARLEGKFENRLLGPTNYFNPVIELVSFRVLQFRQLESTWV
jgi:hypothetical protein